MPDSGGLIQGVIVGLTAGVGVETTYLCHALMSDGRLATAPYGEATLVAAQPKPEAPAAKSKR